MVSFDPHIWKEEKNEIQIQIVAYSNSVVKEQKVALIKYL